MLFLFVVRFIYLPRSSFFLSSVLSTRSLLVSIVEVCSQIDYRFDSAAQLNSKRRVWWYVSDTNIEHMWIRSIFDGKRFRFGAIHNPIGVCHFRCCHCCAKSLNAKTPQLCDVYVSKCDWILIQRNVAKYMVWFASTVAVGWLPPNAQYATYIPSHVDTQYHCITGNGVLAPRYACCRGVLFIKTTSTSLAILAKGTYQCIISTITSNLVSVTNGRNIAVCP